MDIVLYFTNSFYYTAFGKEEVQFCGIWASSIIPLYNKGTGHCTPHPYRSFLVNAVSPIADTPPVHL